MNHAFVMQLKPGCEADYRQRHDDIWPELTALLKGYGIGDYHIYLQPQTLQLFAHFSTAGHFDAVSLRLEPVMQRWWESMSPLMETQPGSHEPLAMALQPMFYLE
ncbi:L-rhamnose mutarotase [Marinobacterium sedimentorum]|uniref:L-rhamnose mutarotase n=1 Tax=Marinobacterium sedimentorum TaxID=2927804 RepID=UPI0020C6C738|nr:L-rhamnose mutarotase [Marinobacterium sedimentorum]MCP8688840.1 L-rhamnose mutarotase [Marinobacterium sedimentorum]